MGGMAECWYCHWGWSRPVVEIYRRHEDVAGEQAMQFGPAHIVWSDENFDRNSVQWCLDHFDRHRSDHNGDELAAVRQSLVDLLALTDDVRDPCPSSYEGERPELFPPAIEMDRKP